jgi:uncharacterized protein
MTPHTPGGTVQSARSLLTVAAVAAGALVVPLAGAASAHVTVQAPGATQGGYTKLTFRVPSEKDVPTTGLEIAFPEDTPIASVRVKPTPGWTYQLTTGAPAAPLENHGTPVEEVVQRIVWTVAEGDPGIGPTEFAEFEVSAGPLPEVDRLLFPALQTYADGEVVRWIEEPVASGAEPEKPAPVLELAAAQDAAEDAGAAPAGDIDAQTVAATEPADSSSGLAVTALVVAGLALASAAASLVVGRRRA